MVQQLPKVIVPHLFTFAQNPGRRISREQRILRILPVIRLLYSFLPWIIWADTKSVRQITTLADESGIHCRWTEKILLIDKSSGTVIYFTTWIFRIPGETFGSFFPSFLLSWNERLRFPAILFHSSRNALLLFFYQECSFHPRLVLCRFWNCLVAVWACGELVLSKICDCVRTVGFYSNGKTLQ
ncbi:hypothetical protein CEXT_139511 [Caerostris extrusa]|uniref:Uncharacterized protein n=1 Tax=Caerostris extrusa TaxID=172846 RepID=A0AAV4TA57_CAEEX|nr:hypothetical protein CEXT_139511 [Caerostris extrusa]